MRHSRFYVNLPLHVGEQITLPPMVFHHVIKVLRKSEGQEIILFNGDNSDYRSVIHQVEKKQANVMIQERLPSTPESNLVTTLAQGISKGQRMDLTLQKAVELGVNRIVLIKNDRSNVRIKEDNLDKKMLHWQNVIISAAEQSGRSVIPQLHEPISISEWLQKDTSDLKVVLSPTATQTLDAIESPATTISLLIGSEGGFTDDEIQDAVESGYQAIRLGPRVLRTETAAFTALAVVQAKWGDLH